MPTSSGASAASANNPQLTFGLFPTAFPDGPAFGLSRTFTWDRFVSTSNERREGKKDGLGFVPARLKLEVDNKRVRRIGKNLLARTAVVLDCEMNKATGELPPAPAEAAARVRQMGWMGVLYTSHNHDPAAPRYRIVLPLSQEIDHQLPAAAIIADRLGLAGVVDRSKLGTNSFFYLPSAAPGALQHHRTIVIPGEPIIAAWMSAEAGSIVAAQRAEQERVAAEARAQAEARRQERIAAGLDPDDSLIAKIRAHLDLGQILIERGYDEQDGKFRHPDSTSGSFGLNIKSFNGIERAYSFNANDPLHHSNLPAWCSGVTAIDAVDVAIILEFGGDRSRALRALAKRYGIESDGSGSNDNDNRKRGKVLARTIFRLLRVQAPQAQIEAAALSEGARLGLSAAQVRAIACWVAETAMTRKAA